MILGEPLTVVRVMHVAGRKRKAVVRGEGGSGNTQLSTGGKKKKLYDFVSGLWQYPE